MRIMERFYRVCQNSTPILRCDIFQCSDGVWIIESDHPRYRDRFRSHYFASLREAVDFARDCGYMHFDVYPQDRQYSHGLATGIIDMVA